MKEYDYRNTKYADMIFSSEQKDLETVESYLTNTKDWSEAWHWINISVAREISDFSKWDEYPLTKKLLKKRIKAYNDVDFGKYSPPFLTTKRLVLCAFRMGRCPNELIEAANSDDSFHFFNASEVSNEELIKGFAKECRNFRILLDGDKSVLIGCIGVAFFRDHWSFD